jgi:L-fucose mutarotase
MLKGLDPLLSPELLSTLCAMGHGDEIAIVDGNYPGVEHARRLIRLDGHHLVPVLDAILSILPIDDFVPEAIFRSTVKADRDALDPVHREMIACCARHEPDRAVVPLVGQDFYGRVRAAHALVQTSEPRLYGNIILRKGVIYPKASGETSAKTEAAPFDY